MVGHFDSSAAFCNSCSPKSRGTVWGETDFLKIPKIYSQKLNGHFGPLTLAVYNQHFVIKLLVHIPKSMLCVFVNVCCSDKVHVMLKRSVNRNCLELWYSCCLYCEVHM